jgi:HEAT repeat protein
VLIAHAEGDEAYAEQLAVPIRAAGYEVVHRGTVLVGESVLAEASKVLAVGAPVVVCGTVRAVGTGWAYQVVSAARGYDGTPVLGVQVERTAFMKMLTFNGEVAEYWRDPERAVAQLLDALAKHYPLGPAAPATAAPDAAIERKFRDIMLQACDIIDLANLPSDRHLATRQLMLRSLFVPLQVRLEREAGQDVEVEELAALERRRHPGAGDRKDPSTASAPLPDLGPGLHPVRSLAPVGQRLAKSRRLVVLGDPGAGKSTLLRWIATAYLLRLRHDPERAALPGVETLPDEEWLPILIRCRELGRDQVSGVLDDMVQQILRRAELDQSEVDAMRAVISRRLDEGTALLLIDGLDEITDPAARAGFCRHLEQIHLARPKTPIIATSRIVGYREMGYRIGRGFEHLTVAELSRDDKDEFVRHWCALTEPADRQEKVAVELVGDIHSTDRIERLTNNPMLLTTMALVKRTVGKLPDRRADLYEQAVKVLLNWRSEVDEPLDYHEAVPQLAYLAYAMSDRGVQQLTDDDLIELLNQMRREYPALYPIQRLPPTEFIRLLERRTGLLEESGYVRRDGRLAPVFEFRHLTFQEYLSAVALVRGYFPGRDRTRALTDNVAVLAQRLTSHETDTDTSATDSWREPIRLTATICNDDEVDTLLLAILPAVAEADNAGARVALAAECLEDEPHVAETTAERIIDELVGRLPAVIDSQVLRLARSRWAPLICRGLIRELRKRGGRAVPTVGRLCGRALGEGAPVREEFASWILDRVASLGTGGDAALQAALTIAAAANERPGAFWSTAVDSATRDLLRLLTTEPVTANAAAWALRELHELPSDHAWHPTDAQIDELMAAINAPGADLLLVANLSSTADLQRRDDPLGPLLAATHDNDAGVRELALRALGIIECDQAIAALIECLDDAESTVCVAAAEALGWQGDSRAVPALVVKVLADDAGFSSAASTALGLIGDERAVEPLLKALDRTDAAAGPAAMALARLGRPEVADRLVAKLAEPDDGEQWQTIQALGELGDSRAAGPLLAALDSPAIDNHWWLLNAVGRIGDRRALPALRVALADSAANVRGRAAWGLGQLADAQVLPDLMGMVHDPDESVRSEACTALGEIGHCDAVPALLVALQDAAATVRISALGALGNLADATSYAPVADQLADPDARVRCAAATAIAKCWNQNSIQLLIDALNDPHPAVRAAVARALGDTDEATAVSPLLDALRDNVATVREAAVDALADLVERGSLTSLRRCLTDRDGYVRGSAAWALGVLRDIRSLPALIQRLDTTNLTERRWVARGLAYLEDDRAAGLLAAQLTATNGRMRENVVSGMRWLAPDLVIEPLLTALTDPDTKVRAEAVESLGAAGDRRAVPALLAQLTHPSVSVRTAAIRALSTIGAVEVVEQLAGHLDDPHPWIRMQAASALDDLFQGGVVEADVKRGRP